MNSEQWSQEDQKWAKEVLACRQIVTEINRFGINDNQRVKLIELLSLEVENHEDSTSLAKSSREILERRETGTTNKGRILT